MTERLTSSSVPVRASGEPQKLMAALKYWETKKLALDAVRPDFSKDQLRELNAAEGRLLAAIEQFEASWPGTDQSINADIAASPSDDGARQPQDWQPIETAPRDGTEIELWGEDGIDIGNWQDAQPDAIESGVVVDPGMDEGFYGCKGYWPGGNQATHWRLPVGPAAASDDGAAREPGLDLEPIKAREAAATKGPWEAKIYEPYPRNVRVYGKKAPPTVAWVQRSDELTPPYYTEQTQGNIDAEFIAHARQDIPALLAEIERQRARIVVLETSVDYQRYLIDHPVTQEQK